MSKFYLSSEASTWWSGTSASAVSSITAISSVFTIASFATSTATASSSAATTTTVRASGSVRVVEAKFNIQDFLLTVRSLWIQFVVLEKQVGISLYLHKSKDIESRNAFKDAYRNCTHLLFHYRFTVQLEPVEKTITM